MLHPQVHRVAFANVTSPPGRDSPRRRAPRGGDRLLKSLTRSERSRCRMRRGSPQRSASPPNITSSLSSTNPIILTLTQSLTRLGANTLGIDASPSNIAIASLHASQDPGLSPFASAPSGTPEHEATKSHNEKGKGKLNYEHTSVEDLLSRVGPSSFDVVCSMEFLEHVDNPRDFLKSCATLVKVCLFYSFPPPYPLLPPPDCTAIDQWVIRIYSQEATSSCRPYPEPPSPTS